VFERIGMMDERYFVYWDDADFVWRARTAGFRLVLDPRAVMYHKVSTSTGGMTSDFSIRYMHRNQMLFTRKFHGPWWTAYTALEAMRDGVVRVLKGRDRPRQAVIRARAIAEGLRVAA
jgi:GT2 family glycosyltransferase